MGTFRTYLRQSRSLTVSLVAVLPLLAGYELALVLLRSRVEVHAGALMRRMLAVLGGMEGYLAVTAAMALGFFLALLLKHRGPERSFRMYGVLILEGALYGALLAPVVFWIESGFGALAAGAPPGEDLVVRVVLGVGAGVWEELLFRFLVLGGLLWITVTVLRGNRTLFGLLAVAASSLAFSLFHHVGPHADPFRTPVFLYRFLAGVLLAGIFLLRGLGVAVYTHALYNVGGLLMMGSAF